MSGVFFYKEFNGHDLGNDDNSLRKKFNTIIKDLKENKLTYQGSIKLISSKGGIKYLRAKLSDEGRLLFTQTKHNNEDIFVILEVIPNHDYENSRFLKSTDKIKSIEIKETETEKPSDTVEIKDLERAHWLGKLVTFSSTQEDIVKRAEECKFPLIISGAAGSGKTSVALESLKKIQEKFEGGKILYITKSENLIKESKKLFECDEAVGELDSKEIDFLSIHEFLEKRTEGIKGKRPIDRKKFFSWFDEICKKDKFKEYKKDGDKIFEEFTAVIAGRALLKGDSFGKDQYKKELGKKESIFPESERDSIYDFFKEYKKFIEEDTQYYDPNLIAHECAEEKIYDVVVVDEVQDLTESTLSLILRSLKDESKRNFLLCGDVNQVVHPSFFSLSKLKSFLYQNKYIRNQGSESFYTLEKNYRNSEQVIELANRILHSKNYCFGPEDKLTEDEKKAFFMKSNTKNTGNVSLIAKDEEQKEVAEKTSGSTSWAVLVLDDEEKENARKLTPLVFNIHEAKGLEFENVILYKFFSNKAYKEIWNKVCRGKDPKKIEEAIKKVRGSCQAKNVNTSQSKRKEDKSLEEYKFYMNALYVAVSRAINNVCIMDNEENCNLLKVIKPEGEKTVSVDIKKEESSPEEWRNKALELIDQGKIEQARNIAETKLLSKEYAEEIMNALKVKECRIESDKDKRELKTEPQKSSAMVPSEKRKRSPSKKKKLTKRELEGNTDKLFLALKNGNLRFAEQLIEQGVNVKDKDKTGFTLLHYAAENSYDGVVKLLLNSGANVNAKSSGKNLTSLHFAAQNGHNGVVQLLLNSEADINAKSSDGNYTPLHEAAGKGRYDIVKLFMDRGANIDAKTEKGSTPLHLTAENGHENVVKLLLSHGTKVDVKTNVDLTPLHFAAQNGHSDVVKLLLDSGADINAKSSTSNGNYTPLHLAVAKGHSAVVRLLLSSKASVDARANYNCTSLYLASQSGRDDIVELLLQKKADVNSSTSNIGYTPLHIAAQKGHKNVVKILLDHEKTDASAKNIDNATPLDIAVQKGHKDVVELLRKYTKEKVQPHGEPRTSEDKARKHKSKNFQDKQQEKANTQELIYALRTCDLQHAEYLIKKKGCTLENSSSGIGFLGGDEGRIILDALQYGFFGVAGLLLQYESDDGKNIFLNWAVGEYCDDVDRFLNGRASAKYGKETPLHEAAQKGKESLACLHKGVVQLLIEHRADINHKDDDGEDWTILHVAARKGDEYIVQLLIDNNADVNAKTKEDLTPLDIAVQKGHKDVVELLRKYTKEKVQPHGESRIPAEKIGKHKSKKFQGEKRKNEKKKLTKRELEENTEKLFSALGGCDSKKAKELIEQGINVNAKDNRSDMGYTLLHSAVLVDNTDIVQLLLKYEELRTDAKISVGCTPLHFAAQMDRTIAAKLLLEHGADVDAKDNMGYTPLHWAVRNDHYDKIDTAKLLLDHGAKVNVKNKEGFTPLDIAEQYGHKDVAKLLRKYIKENSQPKSDLHDVSAFCPSNLRHGV